MSETTNTFTRLKAIMKEKYSCKKDCDCKKCNKGSGKKPTKDMLKAEKQIKKEEK